MTPVFDSEYYDHIWGTVHRHDYAPDLANQLVKKYGKVRFLDIGTGCGHLVKCLRDLGAEAWGIEISEYALGNRCSEFVIYGDVRDIPFKDGFFDVVFSQGLWEYVPEGDVTNAVKEVRRVGRIQEHNIDTSECTVLPEHQFITTKPRIWWDRQFALACPKILVACPVYDGKGYSFGEWVKRVEELTYPNLEVFVVDNSADDSFFNHWKQFIPMERIERDTSADFINITRAMEVIRQKFLAGDYKYWFNLEADIIPPKDVIERLMEHESDWTSHAYPIRGKQTDDQQGIGCSLLSRDLMKDFNFTDAGDNSPDGWLWEKVRPSRGYKVIELWGHFPVDHLGDLNG